MLEKEIADLRTKNSQFRRDIDDLGRKISEMNLVIQDCCKKAAMISRYDEFKDIQIELSGELQKSFHSYETSIKNIGDQSQENRDMLKDVLQLIAALAEKEDFLKGRVYGIESRCEASPIPSQLAQLRNDYECHKSSVECSVNDIIDRLVIPFESIISKQIELVDKSDESLKKSNQAKEISEKIGVEIKILNRKLNQILKELKL